MGVGGILIGWETKRGINVRILTGLILAVLLLVSFAAFAEDGRVNFSGRWSLNSDKSLVRGLRTSAQGELNIYQKENNLSVDKISQKPSGKVTITRKFTLDGKVSENMISGRPTKSFANWSKDGKSLVILSTSFWARGGNKTETKSVEIWKLSEDGKSLLIDYTSRSALGSKKATYVYDKK